MSTHPSPTPLAALAASLPGPVVTLDLAGRVVGITPAAVRLLGCTAHGLAGSPLSDLVRIPVESSCGADDADSRWSQRLEAQAQPGWQPERVPAVAGCCGKQVPLVLTFRAVQEPLGPGWLVELRPPSAHAEQKSIAELADELQTARARYRSLFDRMATCVAVYQAVDDGADFVFTDFNQAAERAEKLRRADVLGRRVTELFPRVRDVGLLEVLQRVHRTGEAEDRPLSFYADDQIAGWRENHVYRLHTGEVVAVYEDVTERKQAEQALRMERDRLRQVFDTTQIALVVTDLQGVVTYASPRASVLFCTPRDQMEGERIDSPAFQLLRRDGAVLRPSEHPLAAVVNGGHSVGDNVFGFDSLVGRRLLRVDATPVMAADHRISEFVFTIDDITEAERDRHELERAERSLSHAQKLGGVGSWESDLKAGKVWWSEQLFRLYELDPRRPPPTSDELRARIHPTDRDVHAAFERRLRDRPGRTTAEYRVRLKDGSIRRLRAFAHHESGPAGTASGRVIGFLQDVTEQRRAEEAQQQARLAAESANRAKSEFLAVMSHELRTPLNAVRGFADLIENSTGEERTRTYARYVVQGADNLTAIIQDILDISSIEAGQLHLDHAPFAPWGVVGEVSRTLMPKASASGLSLMSDVAIDVPPFITGDAQRIRQILLNLVGNAVKFTEAGGTVDVTAEMEDDGRMAIAVRDSGIGLSREQIDRALEPFVQVRDAIDKPVPGTGLGLPLARTMAHLHDATFTISSRPGQGTAITIRFPGSRIVPAGEATGPNATQAVQEVDEAKGLAE